MRMKWKGKMKKKTQHGVIAIDQKCTQNGSKNRIHRKLWLLNEATTTTTAVTEQQRLPKSSATHTHTRNSVFAVLKVNLRMNDVKFLSLLVHLFLFSLLVRSCFYIFCFIQNMNLPLPLLPVTDGEMVLFRRSSTFFLIYENYIRRKQILEK